MTRYLSLLTEVDEVLIKKQKLTRLNLVLRHGKNAITITERPVKWVSPNPFDLGPCGLTPKSPIGTNGPHT